MRINKQITVPSVRLIDEKGQQVGVIKLEQALQIASEKMLDLVEVAPDSKPVVCKLLDYGKHAYQEKKKRNISKSRQRQSLVKEVKFRMSTGANDYQVKLRNIERFLAAGDKVRVSIWFRGREIVHSHLAGNLVNRLKDDLAETANLISEPQIEGKRMNLMFAPQNNTKSPVRSGNGSKANGASKEAAAANGAGKDTVKANGSG
ncbi:MAG: translation initiation factor IF-3 [Betaproteobacteria bacterium]|nr:translation initiation factor IF-3 [Betaproteobacteria bacterium]